ncbi:MAG: biotin attachment protein [Candidatus Omnitrophica bacterium]|nr:biotin attachment protein [Candidatus Omnitrophota bacterium]MDD5355998.1 biotin attachment protein [Candidatus Omnitrophota bacterium]
MAEVILPELGEGIDKATVSYWLFEVGQPVKEGEDLVEMATDKAVFNVPSTITGILKQKVAQDGDEVKVKSVLAVIE